MKCLPSMQNFNIRLNLYHSVDRFSRWQTGDCLLFFSRKQDQTFQLLHEESTLFVWEKSICYLLTLVLLNKLRCHAHFFQPIRLLDPDCCYKVTYLMENSAEPDQLASSEANWSWSTLFAKAGYILYGKPFYYLLSKTDILYIISDILYRI